MPTINAAVVRDQGQSFTVVSVKTGFADQNGFNTFNRQMPHNFPRPVILVEQKGGQPYYFGRTDIVKFLASIDYYQLPWREYSLQ